jgi:hypothetical protein
MRMMISVRSVGAAVAAMVLLSSAALAQAAGPDIHLVPLSMRDGRPVLGAPVNVTSRPGYDNQPSFTPDGVALLFTSVRDDGQADIYRLDLATRATTRLTTTAPESEYSATVVPAGDRFTVIRVERDSAQRLWSFGLDGGAPRVVFQDIKPVGYHAWVDDHAAALFVLGSPATLQLADVRSGRASVIARDIGRSLLPLPGGGGFSYVQRDSAGRFTVMAVRVSGGLVSEMRPVVALPPRGEYIAWLGTDRLLTTVGTRLMYWSGSGEWQEVADLAASGLGALSRLAVSPDGSWLALVADAQRPPR